MMVAKQGCHDGVQDIHGSGTYMTGWRFQGTRFCPDDPVYAIETQKEVGREVRLLTVPLRDYGSFDDFCFADTPMYLRYAALCMPVFMTI